MFHEAPEFFQKILFMIISCRGRVSIGNRESGVQSPESGGEFIVFRGPGSGDIDF